MHHQICASAKAQSDTNLRRLVFVDLRLQYFTEENNAKRDYSLRNHGDECESGVTSRMIQQQRKMCVSMPRFEWRLNLIGSDIVMKCARNSHHERLWKEANGDWQDGRLSSRISRWLQ